MLNMLRRHRSLLGNVVQSLHAFVLLSPQTPAISNPQSQQQISTERLTLSSHIPPSPTASSGFFSSSPPPSASKPPPPFPSYTLQLSYVHSSNNGKALLHKSEATLTKGFGEMFDTKGVLQKEKLEEALEDRWKGVVGA